MSQQLIKMPDGSVIATTHILRQVFIAKILSETIADINKDIEGKIVGIIKDATEAGLCTDGTFTISNDKTKKMLEEIDELIKTLRKKCNVATDNG